MEPRPLQFIARACGGELVGGAPEALVCRVCTDSRQVQPGDLFVALRGDRFDGHGFLAQAAAQGAVAVVAEPGRVPGDLKGVAVVAVDDTRKALGLLGGEYRRAFNPATIAVAGSNGKTTTKELVASVLRGAFPTLANQASFNNELGVPLTLLQLNSGHRAAVLEAGTNHPGELAPLVGLIQPRYGIITNIGREHLEFFGSVEGVAQEEGALAELLPADGKLFLNGDDPWSAALARRTKATIVRVGGGEGVDWRARQVRLDKQGVAFRVESPGGRHDGDYRIQLLGRHMVVNALFALAVGAELGLDRETLQRGLAACPAAKMRLQLWEANGVRVLDDAYNANADSMIAALRTLQDLPCKGRRLAVLGDMAELGAQSEAAHEEVGRYAAETGVGQLFAVGRMAAVLARGARAAGLNRVFEFAEVEAAADAVRRFVRAGDVVLLKASRATRLERVAEALRPPDPMKRN